MLNNSASSAVVCVPARYTSMRCRCWGNDSLGCFPRRWPFAFAIAMPSRVRDRIRSDGLVASYPMGYETHQLHGTPFGWALPGVRTWTSGIVVVSIGSAAER
jgi:hypothetical protein